jgi:hypothetical protein
MADQRCGTCRYYAPTRNPVTGRVLTSEPGQCEWLPQSWPVLSEAFNRPQWGRQPPAPEWPIKLRVTSHHGANCKTWEKK